MLIKLPIIKFIATVSHNWRRRQLLYVGVSILIFRLAITSRLAYSTSILDVRTWPARDYTRVTIESDEKLQNKQQLVQGHNQFIIDLIGIHLNKALRDFPLKIRMNNPHIRSVRVFQNQPDIVKMVFNLKGSVEPQVFTLQPVSPYRYRLVFDLYPVVAPDPLSDLIMQTEHKEQKLKETVFKQKIEIPSTYSSESFFNYYAKNTKNFDIIDLKKSSIDLPSVVSSKNNKHVDDSVKNPHKFNFKKSGNNKTIRLLTVAIDPGHGGEDPGAIGARGTYEKHVVLDIAKKLREKINSVPNMRAMMTRDADFFVPLNVRVQKARRVGADVFVSIHADAFTTSSAQGSSIFVLSDHDSSSKSASWIANNENASDKIGGINIKTQDETVNHTLLDMLSSAQIRDSLRYGCYVLKEVSRISKLHKGSVEQARFAVLKAPDIPSILIETAFISNPKEESKLNDDKYRYKMASAIFQGIKRYFSENPPLSRRVKNNPD
ncbi:MAG: N-acetylmuramoyl-L-alanine amidase [Burkholderia sp.]|nr:N-acetylmuramoyl-L-alanine amidase [Burkholderia sp.]